MQNFEKNGKSNYSNNGLLFFIVWRHWDHVGHPCWHLHHHEPRLRWSYRVARISESLVPTCGCNRTWSSADLWDYVVLRRFLDGQGKFVGLALSLRLYSVTQELHQYQTWWHATHWVCLLSLVRQSLTQSEVTLCMKHFLSLTKTLFSRR